MDNPQTPDNSTIYVHTASQARGVLINHIILLERLMDTYLSKYFCHSEEKAVELMDLIMSTRRITFDSKAQVLKTILEKEFPEKKKENQELGKDFQKIAEERNMLAHYFLDVSEDCINRFLLDRSTFTLLKIEKGRTHEIFDYQRVMELGNLVVNYTDYLANLINGAKN